MSKAILKTTKLKTFGDIGLSLAHNYQVDKNLDKPNNKIHSMPNSELVKTAIKNRLPSKYRKDAVLCIYYLMTVSPDWDGWQNTQKSDEFFKRCISWLNQKHGSQNVIATTIHFERTTPYIVAYVVPIDGKGNLNCKAFLGGRTLLASLQSDFFNQVADLGLKRGLQGSKTTPRTLKNFYQSANKPITPLKTLIEPPRMRFMEGGGTYGHRVAKSVYNALQSEIERFYILADDLQQKNQKLDWLEKSYSELVQKTQVYCDLVAKLQQKGLDIDDFNNEISNLADDLIVNSWKNGFL